MQCLWGLRKPSSSEKARSKRLRGLRKILVSANEGTSSEQERLRAAKARAKPEASEAIFGIFEMDFAMSGSSRSVSCQSFSSVRRLETETTEKPKRTFSEFFGSVGSVFRSVRSILGPRVVVDRSGYPPEHYRVAGRCRFLDQV